MNLELFFNRARFTRSKVHLVKGSINRRSYFKLNPNPKFVTIILTKTVILHEDNLKPNLKLYSVSNLNPNPS